MKKTPLKRVGKKTREWEKVRRQLKKRFMAAGIIECEIGFAQCWRDNGLSFAHGKKRRELIGDELKTLVVLACAPCHTAIEGMDREYMLHRIMGIIANRERQP